MVFDYTKDVSILKTIIAEDPVPEYIAFTQVLPVPYILFVPIF